MLMDDIDRKILKLLQENARMSLKTIAEKTFLSSPAVSGKRRGHHRVSCHGRSHEIRLSYFSVY